MPQPRRRKNRRAAPLGALFLVLAVIGLALSRYQKAPSRKGE